jgi:micrococcal nuclease
VKWLVKLMITVMVGASLIGCGSDEKPETSPVPAAGSQPTSVTSTSAPPLISVPPPTPTAPSKTPRTASASPPTDDTSCLGQAPEAPADAKRVHVKRVIDGDTVELTDATRVRLIGIDTPESVDPRRPVEELGKEASSYTTQLLEGKEILMQLGQTPVDRYGRTLAWLWMLDGTFINAKLVFDGYASVYTFSDNPDHAVLLTKCQSEARNAERGLWDPVTDSTNPATATPATSAPVPAPAPTEPTDSLTVTLPPGTVAKGSAASIEIKTTAGANCSIVVRYKSGPSKAKGLEPKVADGNGKAVWSWNVGSNTSSGTYPVTVTCGSKSVVAELTVP